MKRKFFALTALILACSMLLTLAACQSGDGNASSTPESNGDSGASVSSEGLSLPSTTRLTFGTASVGGVSYVFGSTLAQVLNNNVTNLEVSPEVTGGPVVNIGLVDSGQTDIGHVTDSTSYEGYHGTEWAEGEGYPNIRGLFPTYPSAFQAFAIAGKGIESFADLDGKIVGYGPAGSSGDVIGHNVFKVLGINPSRDQLLGWSDTIGNMKDDIIDAGVDVGGFPHTSRQELEATHSIAFLPLTEEELNRVQAEYPYYLRGTIPAGTHRDMTEDYETIFIWNEVICHKDLDDDIAYMLTKAAYELQSEVARGHVGGETLLAENISYVTIPLHPGAIRYYEEAGITLEDWHYPDDYQR